MMMTCMCMVHNVFMTYNGLIYFSLIKQQYITIIKIT